MADRLDTATISDAIGELNDVVTDSIYVNWVGVFRGGDLLGFMVSNGVRLTFRPADDAMRAWWEQRSEPDDENAPSRAGGVRVTTETTTVKEFLTGRTLHVHDGVAYQPDYGGHCLGCFPDETEPPHSDRPLTDRERGGTPIVDGAEGGVP